MKSTKVSKAKKEQLKKVVAVSNRATVLANKKFEKLSPSEKRVSIARDVLAQLESGKLKPQSGAWLEGKGRSELFSAKMLAGDPEVQSILSKTKECTGCALGGLFLSAVCKADKLKLSELECVGEADYNSSELELVEDGTISENDSFSYLERFFSKEQLNLIEFTFECGHGAVRESSDYDDDRILDENLIEDALSFFMPGLLDHSDLNLDLEAKDMAPDDMTRMRLIMENIVVNKGKFDPTKRPRVVYYTPKFVG